MNCRTLLHRSRCFGSYFFKQQLPRSIGMIIEKKFLTNFAIFNNLKKKNFLKTVQTQHGNVWHLFHTSNFLSNGEVIEVLGPAFAESISEGDIRWLKGEGDFVNADELVAEIETDKTSVEVPAPFSGKIVKLLVKDGSKVKAKQTIYQLEKSVKNFSKTETSSPKESIVEQAPILSPSTQQSSIQSDTKNKLSSPSLSNQPVNDKSFNDINNVKTAFSFGNMQSDSKDITGDRTETCVKMNRMRLRIAERLKTAQNVNAMLTTFNEVDLTSVINIRKKYQDLFLKKHNVKLGLMSPFIRASAIALQNQPIVNAVIDKTEIIYRNYCDISIAVATPKGLVVPVLRNVEKMSYANIEKSLSVLSNKARDGKIAVEDMEGGTFTISNGGVFGSLFGTPIINPPQSAILGMHGIFDRPIAVDGKVEIRPMMYIALTYDHRLIDGREAVMFLRKIKQCVEDPLTILLDL